MFSLLRLLRTCFTLPLKIYVVPIIVVTLPSPKQLPHHFTEGDTILTKNHTAGPFDPKYIGDYRIVSFRGKQVELIPSTESKSKMEHISNIKYIMPAERYISQLPDYEIFGQQTKLCLNPKNILDLSWK